MKTIKNMLKVINKIHSGLFDSIINLLFSRPAYNLQKSYCSEGYYMTQGGTIIKIED